ncbi:phenylalanine--tRNA ligase subunit beta [Candidatus Daviesbacteria bacterium]|nr:phenylalanine--tRNA ligase subunit beta [Candidatus Daviesbacteria bacterium]
MKVSINWLKELVDLKASVEELVKLLALRTIGTKEVTGQYIELDMKGYNRADLLSLRGVAREIAAITDSQITFENENPNKFPWVTQKLPETPVKVENPELAPVYCIVKIEGLKIGPSSKEWVNKLESSGIRSVNNLVDITNLLMVEYGQDMHAFDADCIAEQKLIVRLAKKGEQLTTLDGKRLQLSEEDLIIADPQKPVGLAGIMGGKDSEVSQNTQTIFLEITIFDPIAIRKSSHRHRLHSEAAKRVQHGLTRTNLLQSMSAAIKMYESLGGKVTAITLIGDLKDETKTVTLSQEKINSLVGVDISPEQVEDSLTKLGFTLASHIGSGNVIWEVTVPYWRLDINIEEDIVEEVARMYGYEKIPAKPLTDNIPNIEENPLFEALERLKQALSKTGLTEVQTYSYYSSKVILNSQFSIVNLIKVANPISSETEYLRDNLWPNLLEAVAKNIRNGVKDVAIFEVGKAYLIKNGLPEEPHRLAIALSNSTDNPIAELYQIFQRLGSHLEGIKLNADKKPGRETFHPTRSSVLEEDGKQVGFIAEIHPRIVNKFGIDQRVAVLEIEINNY